MENTAPTPSPMEMKRDRLLATIRTLSKDDIATVMTLAEAICSTTEGLGILGVLATGLAAVESTIAFTNPAVPAPVAPRLILVNPSGIIQ